MNVWGTVSAHIHLAWLFLSTHYLYEKRIGQVTSDVLYTRFTYCCGHQIDLIYFIQYFQFVFIWNAFDKPTRVFHGRFTSYLNGILEFCICMVMTYSAVAMFIQSNFYFILNLILISNDVWVHIIEFAFGLDGSILWIIHGSPGEGRLKRDVVVLSRVLGGSRAFGG